MTKTSQVPRGPKYKETLQARVTLGGNGKQKHADKAVSACQYKGSQARRLSLLLRSPDGCTMATGRTMKCLVLAVLCLQLTEGLVRWVCWSSTGLGGARGAEAGCVHHMCVLHLSTARGCGSRCTWPRASPEPIVATPAAARALPLAQRCCADGSQHGKMQGNPKERTSENSQITSFPAFFGLLFVFLPSTPSAQDQVEERQVHTGENEGGRSAGGIPEEN